MTSLFNGTAEPLLVELARPRHIGDRVICKGNFLEHGASRSSVNVARHVERYPNRRLAAARQYHKGHGGTRLPRHSYLWNDGTTGSFDVVRCTGQLDQHAA